MTDRDQLYNEIAELSDMVSEVIDDILNNARQTMIAAEKAQGRLEALDNRLMALKQSSVRSNTNDTGTIEQFRPRAGMRHPEHKQHPSKPFDYDERARSQVLQLLHPDYHHSITTREAGETLEVGETPRRGSGTIGSPIPPTLNQPGLLGNTREEQNNSSMIKGSGGPNKGTQARSNFVNQMKRRDSRKKHEETTGPPHLKYRRYQGKDDDGEDDGDWDRFC